VGNEAVYPMLVHLHERKKRLLSLQYLHTSLDPPQDPPMPTSFYSHHLTPFHPPSSPYRTPFGGSHSGTAPHSNLSASKALFTVSGSIFIYSSSGGRSLSYRSKAVAPSVGLCGVGKKAEVGAEGAEKAEVGAEGAEKADANAEPVVGFPNADDDDVPFPPPKPENAPVVDAGAGVPNALVAPNGEDVAAVEVVEDPKGGGFENADVGPTGVLKAEALPPKGDPCAGVEPKAEVAPNGEVVDVLGAGAPKGAVVDAPGAAPKGEGAKVLVWVGVPKVVAAGAEAPKGEMVDAPDAGTPNGEVVDPPSADAPKGEDAVPPLVGVPNTPVGVAPPSGFCPKGEVVEAAVEAPSPNGELCVCGWVPNVPNPLLAPVVAPNALPLPPKAPVAGFISDDCGWEVCPKVGAVESNAKDDWGWVKADVDADVGADLGWPNPDCPNVGWPKAGFPNADVDAPGAELPNADAPNADGCARADAPNAEGWPNGLEVVPPPKADVVGRLADGTKGVASP
jgi:hypothetical protein